MIDVSPADFLRIHGGIARVLKAIEQAGPAGVTGVPSRKLGLDVFNSYTYGNTILKRASEMGYIRRKKVPRPKGKGRASSGRPQVLNYLTPAGCKLLRELAEEEEGRRRQ